MALAQRDGNTLHVRIGFEHLVSKCFVFFAVQFAGLDVHIDCNFERLLHVFFVGDCHIDVLCHLTHDLRCLLAILPEIFTIVEVAGNSDVPLLRFLHRLERQHHRGFGNCGRNTRDVEPVNAFKRFIPVDIAGLCHSNGGIRTVVDDLARQLVRAAL